MKDRKDAIKTIFGEELKLFTWELTEKKLKWLKNVIPESEYFYNSIQLRPENSSVYWNTVLRASLKGKKREELGDTLYFLSDEEEVHWFAMNKKYEYLINILEPTIKLEEYFESFNSADSIEAAREYLEQE